MKITQIGHASTLVESRGIAILSDPWWKGPCFGAQWWIYPRPFLEPLEQTRIDYIYISHGHHDHFHGGTLRTLPKTAIVLVCKELGLGDEIRSLGFEVVEIPSRHEIELGSSGVKCRIVQTHGHDSLVVFDDGERVVININDALHSAPHAVQDRCIAELKQWYPRIDYVLCGYGIASHFPNCYALPGKDDGATAVHRQKYFNREWVRVVRGLNPRFAFPFAADVVLLEDALFWANAPVHNGERPVTALKLEHPDSAIEAIDIAPGFVIENDTVLDRIVQQPLDESLVREQLADGIRRSNTVAATSPEAVDEIGATLRARVERLQPGLATFAGDYRLLIRFHNSRRHLAFVKQGSRVTLTSVDDPDDEAFDIVYATRLAYLKWALVEQRGDEILFVGSGGIFRYRTAALIASNAHRELMGLLRDRVAVRPTQTPARAATHAAKQLVKKLIGRRDVDLYDLNQWTVYRA